jgi:Family of unknown function (DUF6338)
LPTTILAFNLLILLLPGFVTLKVREALAMVAKTSDLSRVVDAMLFTLLNYAIYFTLATLIGLKQFTFLSLTEHKPGGGFFFVVPYLPALFPGFSDAWLQQAFMGISS